MTYNNKAKLKTLYVKQLLEQETDEEHGLSMRQLIQRLAELGIKAERKSLYRDIEVLQEFGCEIRTYQRNPVEYALVKRSFELSELMLMVDAVQSCKALTTRQANALVSHIKQLASSHQRELLDRHIHVPDRIRTKAESVFGNIDVIHQALREKRQLEFTYYRRGLDGKRTATRQGRPHVVTPVEVVYADGFYYLTAWDQDHGNMAEYRVDRMGRARLSQSRAVRNDQISHYVYDGNAYLSFGRYGGEEVCATLRVCVDRVEIVTDRFGDVDIIPVDDQTAHAFVRVRKSQQFFGWVAGLGKKVTIAGPQSLVDEYRAYLRNLLED